jgi:hypothetical protein
MSKKTYPGFDGVTTLPAPNDRIPVGAEDYARAVPGDQYKCALAWAIRRKYPQALRIRVNRGEVSFSIGDQRMHYPSDDQIVEQVIRPLDTGGELKPTTVRLHDGYVTPVQYSDEDQLAKKRIDMAERSAQARRAGENPSAASGFRRFKRSDDE